MTLDRAASHELERPVESVTHLVDHLRAGEKPVERWLVGTEYEKLPLRVPDIEPVPYEGERGIEALLRRLAELDGWNPLTEAGHVMGLERDGLGVSLEPGAQVELNGRPLRTLFETCSEFRTHLERLNEVAEPFGIAWLGLGLQPFHEVDALPRVPRERYRIMREYLPRRGDLALDMMHATASVQVSVDYQDEADMVDKLRTALAVTPLVSALYANSPLSGGRPNGFVSRRLHIWTRTDPDRSGLLPLAFEPDFGYRRYVEWALDVPMFFLIRATHYHAMRGRTFRRFLAEGHEGEHPTLADWDRHLTTLFPHARLKRILEVRCADAVPPDLLCSIPALWKGILYDAQARQAAAQLVKRWGAEDREAVLAEVAREGLGANTPEGPLLGLARELVAIAREGLRRIGHLPPGPPSEADERVFLDPLHELLETGRSPGQWILERWQNEWGGQPDRLIEYVRY